MIVFNVFKFFYYYFIEAIPNETKFNNVNLKEIEDCVQKYLAQRPFVVKRKKATIITNTEDDVCSRHTSVQS